MPVSADILRRRAKRALAGFPLRPAAALAAGVRGHGVALLFHRVGSGPAPHEVVTSVDASVFRRQVETVGRLGDIIPAAELTGRRVRGSVPRFALTFDDDYASHAETVLPILRDLDVPATFFVGGRGLHRLGPYWWEVLERRIAADGVESTARSLGLEASTPAQLAAACEGTATADLLTAEGAGRPCRHLDARQLEALATAPGITLGFHTLHHPLLRGLAADRLAAAMREGRSELASATGVPLRLFAYPHGKADTAAASAARDAGFDAAFTGRFAPVRPGDDPFLLGRWEPHSLAEPAFTATLTARLHRTAPAP